MDLVDDLHSVALLLVQGNLSRRIKACLPRIAPGRCEMQQSLLHQFKVHSICQTTCTVMQSMHIDIAWSRLQARQRTNSRMVGAEDQASDSLPSVSLSALLVHPPAQWYRYHRARVHSTEDPAWIHLNQAIVKPKVSGYCAGRYVRASFWQHKHARY
jgi:hypothetical protein